jgi:general secretion pathway protein D
MLKSLPNSPLEALQRLLGVVLLLLAASLPSSPPRVAWAEEVPFTFENAEVHTVIKKASELTGMTFLFDPEQVKGKITILSPKKVSPEEALQLLQSALALRGYTLIEEKGIARIVPAEQAAYVARETIEVIPLNHAKAEELAYALAYGAPYGVTIFPYYPTNSLIISGNPEAVEELIGIIRGKEEKPEEQGD